MYNKRKLIMAHVTSDSAPSPPTLPIDPTCVDIDNYVNSATKDELKLKYSTIGPNRMGIIHPSHEYLKSKIEEKFPDLNTSGGRRSSKKHPTARRRRSSKARKSRKVRKSRTTRRKY